MSYLYKRSNRIWHWLIPVASPPPCGAARRIDRRRHLRFGAAGGANRNPSASAGAIITAASRSTPRWAWIEHRLDIGVSTMFDPRLRANSRSTQSVETSGIRSLRVSSETLQPRRDLQQLALLGGVFHFALGDDVTYRVPRGKARAGCLSRLAIL